jgi:hypothetical protein
MQERPDGEPVSLLAEALRKLNLAETALAAQTDLTNAETRKRVAAEAIVQTMQAQLTAEVAKRRLSDARLEAVLTYAGELAKKAASAKVLARTVATTLQARIKAARV